MRYFATFCFICLCTASLAQIQKVTLSLGGGQQRNVFKSPNILPDSDVGAWEDPREGGSFLNLEGEFDLRKQWGNKSKNGLSKRHRLDWKNTLKTRQFIELSDASTLYGNTQLEYRYKLTKNLNWKSRLAYTHLSAAEDIRTPNRNILFFAFHRLEGRTGIEYKGWKNHLSTLTLKVADKNFIYQNSLDRMEYSVQWSARQRIKKTSGRSSYLRLTTIGHFRDFKNTRGSGFDQEGFAIRTGKRRIAQLHTEFSVDLFLNEQLLLRPGLRYRYRKDIFPQRFGYTYLGPMVDLRYRSNQVDMGFSSTYTHRSYHSFQAPSNESEMLRYLDLALRWQGVYRVKGFDHILPYWDVGWNSRSSNALAENRANFRSYKNYYLNLGLQVRWR